MCMSTHRYATGLRSGPGQTLSAALTSYGFLAATHTPAGELLAASCCLLLPRRPVSGGLCTAPCSRPARLHLLQIHQGHTRGPPMRAAPEQLRVRQLPQQPPTLLLTQPLPKHDGSAAGLAAQHTQHAGGWRGRHACLHKLVEVHLHTGAGAWRHVNHQEGMHIAAANASKSILLVLPASSACSP